MLGSKNVLDMLKSEKIDTENDIENTTEKTTQQTPKIGTWLTKEREARSSGNSKTRADTWKKRDRRKDTRKNE